MKKTALKKQTRNADVRLLPAVIGVGAILFALKAAGFAFSASAAPAATPPAAAATPAAAAAPTAPAAQSATAQPVPAQTAPKPASDPLAAINAALPKPALKPAASAPASARPADDLPPELAGSGVSSAEMDVLTSLADRRDTLDERQRQLDLKASVISAAEKRVDDKIAQLKALQAKIESMMGQRDQMETQQLDALVKVYSAMKPKDAARIFSSLDDSVRIGVAGRMKADTMAGILSALPAEVAQKLTVELAGRYKVNPETAAAAASATAPASAARGPAAQPSTPPGG
jgi:flagellar motility protein MotE (MotC chaperone)